ncbi:MAG: fibronectin type III domain-containing protein, partial [Planctomycetes bacterium]|nr:fibronectin type III domain-containing protein [Planctomycetota bacterium]
DLENDRQGKSRLFARLDVQPIHWDPVDYASVYYVECANDANFTSINANSSWITDTSYEFCGLSPHQTYWYRIKAWGPFSHQTWLQTSQVDFNTDTLTNTVATDSGDVILVDGNQFINTVHAVYLSTGNIVTTGINLPAEDTWAIVDFNTSTPPDTDLTVDILPAAGSTPIPGYENIAGSTDLSGIGEQTIRLRANLSTTDTNYTPTLHDWSISFANPTSTLKSDWSFAESSLQVATPGDFEPDCDVDLADFVVFNAQWLMPK